MAVFWSLVLVTVVFLGWGGPVCGHLRTGGAGHDEPGRQAVGGYGDGRCKAAVVAQPWGGVPAVTDVSEGGDFGREGAVTARLDSVRFILWCVLAACTCRRLGKVVHLRWEPTGPFGWEVFAIIRVHAAVSDKTNAWYPIWRHDVLRPGGSSACFLGIWKLMFLLWTKYHSMETNMRTFTNRSQLVVRPRPHTSSGTTPATF